ncbi:MAG: hypothetical protein GF372_11720 [Candidatus Marinimicrobia bacterium]|nr:hypothetical protein [Candidatus Neomarinimicrobiota bacterium]
MPTGWRRSLFRMTASNAGFPLAESRRWSPAKDWKIGGHRNSPLCGETLKN